MHTLDKKHIKLIEADVETARIIITDLSDELIDHICCEVENQMSQGISFEEAYEIIKQQTGIKVLQQIQQDTLYLIDKNYRIMKTIMKITGNVALVFLALGTVFKIFHWPGASIGLGLGFLLLCIFFFPSVIYVSYREGKGKSPIALNISILIGGILLMAGVFFKVMHWPGNDLLLAGGWAIILLIFLPILLYVKLKNAKTTHEKAVYTLGVSALAVFELSTVFKMFHWPGASIVMIIGSLLLVSFFLPLYTNMQFKQTNKITGQYIFIIILSMYAVVLNALLALNAPSKITNQFNQDEANASKIVKYFEEKKMNHPAAPDSLFTRSVSERQAISAQADNLSQLIANIKIELIQKAEQVDSVTANNYINNTYLISNNKTLMVDLPSGNHKSSWKNNLKPELENFKEIVSRTTSSNPELSSSLTNLLNTSVDMAEPKPEKENKFGRSFLINTLSALTSIERNVRQVESDIIYNSTLKK